MQIKFRNFFISSFPLLFFVVFFLYVFSSKDNNNGSSYSTVIKQFTKKNLLTITIVLFLGVWSICSNKCNSILFNTKRKKIFIGFMWKVYFAIRWKVVMVMHILFESVIVAKCNLLSVELLNIIILSPYHSNTHYYYNFVFADVAAYKLNCELSFVLWIILFSIFICVNRLKWKWNKKKTTATFC